MSQEYIDAHYMYQYGNGKIVIGNRIDEVILKKFTIETTGTKTYIFTFSVVVPLEKLAYIF